MKQPILLWCEWGELFARSLRNAGQPAQGSPSASSEALTNGFCAPSVWLDPQRLHTRRVSMERLVSTVATAEPEGWKAVWEALACPPAPSRSAVCLSGEGAEVDQPALCRQGVRSQVFCQPPLPWPEDCPGHLCGCSVSAVQSLRRVRLFDPLDRSTPGLPVHHQLPESTQTHVHRVGEAIQPSHVLGATAFYFIFQTSMEGETGGSIPPFRWIHFR